MRVGPTALVQGDRFDVVFNGETVASNQALDGREKVYTQTLLPGPNYVAFRLLVDGDGTQTRLSIEGTSQRGRHDGRGVQLARFRVGRSLVREEHPLRLLTAMRLPLALFALTVLAGRPAAAQPRHDGVFAYPGDEFVENDGDCGTIYATDRAVSAYPEPRAVGTPTRRAEAGRRIVPSGVSNVMTVLRAPGRLVTRRDLTVGDAQRDGSESDLRIARGTRVDVIDYAGEGYVKFRVGGVDYYGQGTIPVDASWVTAETRTTSRS